MVIYQFYCKVLKDELNEEISSTEIGETFLNCFNTLDFRFRKFFGIENYEVLRVTKINENEND